MKTNTIIKTIFSALFGIALVAQAKAGPGPQQIFTPIKTMEQAQSIKPGEKIAFHCGACGTFSVTIADKDRSYLRGHTCATCNKKFILRDSAHGQPQGAFILQDDEKHIATLLQMH